MPLQRITEKQLHAIASPINMEQAKDKIRVVYEIDILSNGNLTINDKCFKSSDYCLSKFIQRKFYG